jgi:hypothetical protein
LAVAVSKIMPSVEIIFNENAQPDKRSYKVDFSLFSKLAPEFTPIKTLEETILELKEGIEKHVSKFEDFRTGKLIRYNILNNYIVEKSYNSNLFLV